MTDAQLNDPIQQQSRHIQAAYAQMAEEITEDEATVRTLTEEEARFAVSQYQMMWRRFRSSSM